MSDLGDGIHQIRVPMAGSPLRHVNVYAVLDADGVTLVDCGWKTTDALAGLEAGLAAAGLALAQVHRIALTHAHHDHYGLAGTLRARGVPELLMHEREWAFAQRFADGAAFDREADAWLARNGYAVEPDEDEGEGAPWYAKAELTPPTRLVRGGEKIGRLRVLWTPGHSPGHCAFVDERSGRVLTGDHILEPITPHVGLWRETPDDPLGDYLASLDVVAALRHQQALPAHGEPFGHLQRRIDELRAHAAQREADVLAALGTAAASGARVARALRWTRRAVRFEELSPAHRQFAVAETLGHLHHLAARGVARREAGADGTLTYRTSVARPVALEK